MPRMRNYTRLGNELSWPPYCPLIWEAAKSSLSDFALSPVTASLSTRRARQFLTVGGGGGIMIHASARFN
jgi:hypothetical protein